MFTLLANQYLLIWFSTEVGCPDFADHNQKGSHFLIQMFVSSIMKFHIKFRDMSIDSYHPNFQVQ